MSVHKTKGFPESPLVSSVVTIKAKRKRLTIVTMVTMHQHAQQRPPKAESPPTRIGALRLWGRSAERGLVAECGHGCLQVFTIGAVSAPRVAQLDDRDDLEHYFLPLQRKYWEIHGICTRCSVAE